MSTTRGRHRKSCTACGRQFYLIGKNQDHHERCDACVRTGIQPRVPIEKAVPLHVQEPAKGMEPSPVLTDYNGRDVSAKALQIRLMRGW